MAVGRGVLRVELEETGCQMERSFKPGMPRSWRPPIPGQDTTRSSFFFRAPPGHCSQRRVVGTDVVTLRRVEG